MLCSKTRALSQERPTDGYRGDIGREAIVAETWYRDPRDRGQGRDILDEGGQVLKFRDDRYRRQVIEMIDT